MSACDQHHCVTCGDVAEPMEVTLIDRQRGLALCLDQEDVQHTVEIALIEPVDVGDRVLVHAGVALTAEPA